MTTIGQLNDRYPEILEIVAAGTTPEGKPIVVVRVGDEGGELSLAIRKNVDLELANLPLVDATLTLAEFFGKQEPDGEDIEAAGTQGDDAEGAQVEEAAAEAGQGEEALAEAGGQTEAAPGDELDAQADEDDQAAGFVVLVDGEIKHAFVCQWEVFGDGDINDYGPYILGFNERTDDDGSLALALRAASEWAQSGNDPDTIYFVSESTDDDQLAGLGDTYDVETTISTGEGDDEKTFAILSLDF